MGIPLGIDRKIAHHATPTLKRAAGGSGVAENYLASLVSNPQIALSYKSFTSPTEKVATLSLSYETSVV